MCSRFSNNQQIAGFAAIYAIFGAIAGLIVVATTEFVTDPNDPVFMPALAISAAVGTAVALTVALPILCCSYRHSHRANALSVNLSVTTYGATDDRQTATVTPPI